MRPESNMAEVDPDETNTFPEGEGETDEGRPLLHHQGEDIEMKGRHPSGIVIVPLTTNTSTSRGHEGTSFITDTPSGKIYSSRAEQSLAEREAVREKLDEKVKQVFPNIVKYRLAQIYSDEYERIFIREAKKNSIPHMIIDSNGKASRNIELSKFSKGIRKDLGKTNMQINKENHDEQLKREEEQAKREVILAEAKRKEEENKEQLSDGHERRET